MSRRTLGSLASAINVAGAEAVNATVGPERTPLERYCIGMYQRREEAWRPPNLARVTTFVELFLIAMARLENAYHDGRPPITARILITTLRKRIIPWIERHIVWTMDALQWPMSLEHFNELDMFLAGYLPRLWSQHRWQNISYFYGEVKKNRRRSGDGKKWKEDKGPLCAAKCGEYCF